MQDAFDTALLITKRDANSDNFTFLQKGIGNIVNFIITTFRIEEAIICASKIAYLTQMLNQKSIPEVSHFTSAVDLANITISQSEYAKLNRLKNTSPEAFFYWYHALNLMSLEYPETN